MSQAAVVHAESAKVNAAAVLVESRQAILNQIAGLSEAQWNFKPSAESWSAAGIVEHLAIVEGAVVARLSELEQMPAAPEDLSPNDATVLDLSSRAGQKFQSPPMMHPTGLSGAEALASFESNCESLVGAAANENALRKHALPHPVFGVIDAYQWILAVSSHNRWHVLQFEELKAAPGYPAR